MAVTHPGWAAGDLQSVSDTGALSKSERGDDVVFVQTTAGHVQRSCPDELVQGLPGRPRGASANLYNDASQVAP